MGLNSNVMRGGVDYHVQTEDLVGTSRVRTQVFVDGGRVLHTDHYSYAEHLGVGGLEERLMKVMRACHRKVVQVVEKGLLDEAYRLASGTVALVRKRSEVRAREPEVVKAPSEVWDSLVREAHRRRVGRRTRESRPPIAWDQVIENLRKSG